MTDANLHLGRLDPGYFLGGRMTLDESAAEQALHAVAMQLGLSDTDLAEGMLAIINAKMADAMRTITVKQGIDPREFSLVAFGGAGPMHAVWLAKELEIGEVIVPWSPGTFSAWGMLQTDMRHDVVRSFYQPLTELDANSVAEAFTTLEQEGDGLLEGEGIGADERYFARSADMRYVGQEYSVAVPIGPAIDLDEIDGAFHEAHRVRYGHSTPGAPVEFVNLRVAAMGRIAAAASPFQPPEDGQDPVLGRRTVIFDHELYDTPVLMRERIVPGTRSEGPVIIEEPSATTVVPPGYVAAIDELGDVLITQGKGD